MRSVDALAQGLSLAFHALKVEVTPSGPSLQGRARAARYEALLELAARVGADCVALGHTRDDQAETVLDRNLRGAGLRGIAAIQPRRGDGVVRPLLDATREDVRAYLGWHSLGFVTDPSNADGRHLRSRIRHGLLPALEVEDPAIREHLANLADDARDLEQYVEARARRWLARHMGVDGTLRAEAVVRLPRALRRRVLAEWVTRNASGVRPGRAQRVALEGLAALPGGPILLGQGWGVTRCDGNLRLERRNHWPTRSTPSLAAPRPGPQEMKMPVPGYATRSTEVPLPPLESRARRRSP
ncbi:MAG: tRNA lysidine(34) synthetase TilS [Myxococcales bacterium]|nr:tRNA lysidine(34) synthetase TilS [Myxococcales bacterium]